MNLVNTKKLMPIISDTSFSDPYFQIIYQNTEIRIIFIPENDSTRMNYLFVVPINKLSPREYPIETYQLIIEFLSKHNVEDRKTNIYLEETDVDSEVSKVYRWDFIDYNKIYINDDLTEITIKELPNHVQEYLLESR